MLSTLSRVTLFASSFSPLILVFAVLESWGAGLPTVACYALAVLAAAALPFLLRVARQFGSVPLGVKVAKQRESEALTYVATFLVPFLTAETETVSQRIALGIFIALITLLYIQTDLYFWNPLLALRGYRAIEIELGNEEVVTLLTVRRHIRPQSEVHAIPIASTVYWERRDNVRS